MHERIRELANEALMFANQTMDLDPDISDSTDSQVFAQKYVAIAMNKHAELIVKECMNICKEHPSRTLSNRWNGDAVAPDIVRIFEEHFGVEE